MKQTIESIMTSFQNSGKKHLLLTGAKGSGKTERFLEIAKLLCDFLPGITTYAVPCECVMLKENGTANESVIGCFDGQMKPCKEGFEELGVSALLRAMEGNSEWIGIDELGFLENENVLFQKAVTAAFEKKRVLAVLRKQELSFLMQLKKRDDVFVMDLDEIKMKVGCVIMASGKSVRFGSNKLLQEFCGKTLFQRTLDTTAGLFDKRVVVTRTQEVQDICKKQGLDVILHDFSYRNDVVRLGTEYLSDMDALVFCPCDQPLLRRESVERLLQDSFVHDDFIVRMAAGDRRGAPILFGKRYFEELCMLPEKAGGSYLAKKYPDKVRLVHLEDENELEDIDTPEDMEWLLNIVERRNEEL